MAKRKNTSGKVVGEPPVASAKADEANPPAKKHKPEDKPDEKGRLQKIKDGIDDSVDAWVERNGYSHGSMIAGAAAKAFNELLTPTAVWELIPVGKAFKLLKKGGQAVGLGRKAEKAGEVAADAGKAGGKKPPGGKVKAKKKMKCGEYGEYGNQKNKTGDGAFDRDHVPSKAALKEKALKLKQAEFGPKAKLSAAQQKAIDDWGKSIAIPKQAHRNASPTYGGRNTESRVKSDAGDLAGAARRDAEAMLKELDDYEDDHAGCKKKYQKAAGKIMRMSNEDYKKGLLDILEKVK